ncbi:hypothetical protein GCM10007857_58400 [Bradyrhizobium iriomotense]|uniref:Uncharacterized protein n=1 Tax=Bradyrhizobium iriomotense TaxID=441950 RepID=A0ABQ6B3Y4_9BRAD|nr:hypothetical protein GCM10007857_58400 [Bradyrhizobium iriomotense]
MIDESDALHIRARWFGYDLGNLASRPDLKIWNRFRLLPEDELEQRPRCAYHPRTELALRQTSDLGMFETDIPGNTDGNAASPDECVLETGENLVHGFQAAGEKTVRVSALRDTKTCLRGRLQDVALQKQDLPEIGCQNAGRR